MVFTGTVTMSIRVLNGFPLHTFGQILGHFWDRYIQPSTCGKSPRDWSPTWRARSILCPAVAVEYVWGGSSAAWEGWYCVWVQSEMARCQTVQLPPASPAWPKWLQGRWLQAPFGHLLSHDWGPPWQPFNGNALDARVTENQRSHRLGCAHWGVCPGAELNQVTK